MQKYLLVITLLVGLAACKDNVELAASVDGKLDKRTVVEIAEVGQETETFPIYAIGRLESDAQLKMSFKIGGVIASIRVKEGQRVRKGKTLATLRSDEIDAQVLKAKQALDKAERDLERTKKMFAEDAATSENVDDLTTLVEVSKADLEIAKFNKKYARIISPVKGRIIKRMAEPNELVSPGQPLFLLGSNEGNAIVMKVALSDKDISRVSFGDNAKVHFDAFPQEDFDAEIVQIAEASDPKTGTFFVELNVDAKGKRLRNGYIGRAEIFPTANNTFLTIPMAALVEGNENEVTIFVPSENNAIAKKVIVEPLQIRSDFIAIKKPEMDINRVITAGAPYLLDGDSIRVKQLAASSSQSAVSRN